MSPEAEKREALEMECDRSFWLSEGLKAVDAGDDERAFACRVMYAACTGRLRELRAGCFENLPSTFDQEETTDEHRNDYAQRKRSRGERG